MSTTSETEHRTLRDRVAQAIYEAGLPKGGRDYVAWDDLESDGFYAQHDLAMKQAHAAIGVCRAADGDLKARLSELERENAALRKALQRIRSELEMHINWKPTGVAVEVAIAFEIAREALAGSGEK